MNAAVDDYLAAISDATGLPVTRLTGQYDVYGPFDDDSKRRYFGAIYWDITETMISCFHCNDRRLVWC
jgi:hypothetical protein